MTVDDPAGSLSGTRATNGAMLNLIVDAEEYSPFAYTIRNGQSLQLQL